MLFTQFSHFRGFVAKFFQNFLREFSTARDFCQLGHSHRKFAPSSTFSPDRTATFTSKQQLSHFLVEHGSNVACASLPGQDSGGDAPCRGGADQLQVAKVPSKLCIIATVAASWLPPFRTHDAGALPTLRRQLPDKKQQEKITVLGKESKANRTFTESNAASSEIDCKRDEWHVPAVRRGRSQQQRIARISIFLMCRDVIAKLSNIHAHATGRRKVEVVAWHWAQHARGAPLRRKGQKAAFTLETPSFAGTRRQLLRGCST